MVIAQAPARDAPKRRGGTAERLPVRAVQRAFDLLARIGAERAGATLSGLARDCALPVSTVARLLATLEQSGFVRRDPDGLYRPGGRLLQIGLTSLNSTDLYELAAPHLKRLCEASGETANLAVRADRANAIYLRQVVSPQSIHHASWLGRLLPLRKTAAGAVLLGEAPRGQAVTRRDTLEEGVTAIAAPVVGAAGNVVAAMSITGPSFRIGERECAQFSTLVAREAEHMSKALGAPQPPA
jgi:IclR family acetate operon transcriptional repressor